MPLYYLIALFIGLPIIELALLLKLHDIMGLLPTIALVLFTGIAGAALVRRQGLSTLLKIQQQMAMGNVPTPQLMDGVMILAAGIMLVTPGIITDTAGFLLLVPAFRSQIRLWLKKLVEEKIRSGYIQIHPRSPRDFQ